MRLILFVLTLQFLFLQSDFANTPEPQQAADQKVISGVVLLNNKTAPDAKALLAALKKTWKLRVDSSSIADKTIVFAESNATVMIAFLDYPVAPAEIRTAAQLSWLWRNAGEEALRHQSQVVISVIGTSAKTLDLYQLFTRVVGGVLEQTNSSGCYMAGQYLLLSKAFYTAAAANMRDNKTLPLYCWTYFGMISENGKSSGYTYGLQEFGLEEMEIVNAEYSAQEVHAMLYDAAQTVVQYNMKLEDGKAFTTLEGQQLIARRSKAAFQEGETLKLEPK